MFSELDDYYDWKSDVLIAEHELMNSSADRVYELFRNRSEKEGRIENTWIGIEQKLLDRNDALINLAIAKYGCDLGAVRKIFGNSIENKNQALILSCLSNTAMGRCLYLNNFDMPIGLFESEADLEKWFSNINGEEIYTLFKNETIQIDFQRDYLSGDKYWNLIDDDRHLISIEALTNNKGIRGESLLGKGIFDDVATAAWHLADRVPVTETWAKRLSHLYQQINYPSLYSYIDFKGSEKRNVRQKKIDVALRKVIDRWKVEEEVTDSKKRSLSSYEYMRYQLYKLVTLNKGNPDDNDIACRVRMYQENQDQNTDWMKYAYEKDGLIAIDYMLDNNWIWLFNTHRNFLEDLCAEADKKYISVSYKLKFQQIEYEIAKKERINFKGSELDHDRQPTWGEVEDMFTKHEGQMLERIIELREEAYNFIFKKMFEYIFILILGYQLLKYFGLIH